MTPDEQMLAHLRAHNVPYPKIAHLLGRTEETLHRWAKRLGLTHATPEWWTTARVDKLRELAKEGKRSAAEIGRILGCSRNTVIGKARREGIALRPVNDGGQRRGHELRQRAPKAEWEPKVQKVVMELQQEPTAETWTRLVDTKDDQCRWPVSEPDHNMLCCGAKKAHDATSYCFHHWKMSINPHQRSRDERLPTSAAEA